MALPFRDKQFFRHAIAALTALALMFGISVTPALLPQAQAAPTPRPMVYLGVLVEFPDLDTDLDSPEALTILDAITTAGGDNETAWGSKPITSLEKYVEQQSYGKIDLSVDFFPKATNGTAPVAYTAPKSRGYYMPYDADKNPDGYRDGQRAEREKELFSGALDAVRAQIEKKYSAQQLDSDDDGVIDAINFYIASGWLGRTNWGQDKAGDLLWSYKTDANYLGVLHGKSVNAYNVDNMYDPASAGSVLSWSRKPDGSVTANRAGYTVILHEFMHTFGLKDLYRSNEGADSTANQPVGFYGLMAKQDSFTPQPLLAFESAQIGWSDPIPALQVGETKEICPAQFTDPAENRAVKITSVLNQNEYFIVDAYRKGGQINEGTADGALIYRINSKEYSNLLGSAAAPNKDMLFIYRPGETTNGEANAKGDNLKNAVLTAGTTYGKSLEETAGWDKDALYFSDGSNSGIKVTFAPGTQADCLNVSYTAPQAQGTGAQDNPFLITSAQDWKNFVQPGKYAQLAADIDFGGAAVPTISGSDIHLDGNGHTLANLTTAGGGLFGDLISSNVHDLTIDGITAQGADGDHVGAFANSVSDTAVTNVHVLSGTVTGGAASQYGSEGAGGFVGTISGSSTISASSTAADVTGGKNRGAFIGLSQGGNVTGSSASGRVNSGGAENAGGFYGSFVPAFGQYTPAQDAVYSNNLYLVTDPSLNTAHSAGDKDGIIGVLVQPDALALDVETSPTGSFAVTYCFAGNACAADSSAAALSTSVKDEKVASVSGNTVTAVAQGETDVQLAFLWGSAELTVPRRVTVTGTTVDPNIPTSEQPENDVQISYSDPFDSEAADAKKCETGAVAQSKIRITVTTPYVWNAQSQKWELDTAQAQREEETVEAGERAMTDTELQACATKPAKQIVAGDWADGNADTDWDYDSRTVTQYRTVTVTPYIWDSTTHAYVLDNAHATEKTETQTRPMTSAEIKEHTPQPADKVDVSESEPFDSDAPDAHKCESHTVNQLKTIVTITTPYTWNDSTNEWVLNSSQAQRKEETAEAGERAMTDTELQACSASEPLQPTDPTQEDPKPTPSQSDAQDEKETEHAGTGTEAGKTAADNSSNSTKNNKTKQEVQIPATGSSQRALIAISCAFIAAGALMIRSRSKKLAV